MAKGLLFPCSILVLNLIISLCLLTTIQAADDERKAYIVYMGDGSLPYAPLQDTYNSMMKKVYGSDVNLTEAAKHMMHTYRNFHGCVAKLTDKEVETLSRMDGVMSVFTNRKKKLRTTRSWDFMDFPLDVKRSSVESDVIIGMIDTGVWPESESFSDEGFGPPPAKWKGRCDTAQNNFTCNNKIIGAQYFRVDGNIALYGGIPSPRDTIGHGTHTTSTAAGGVVPSASFLGLGEGTARGGVPSARIAVYKVCWLDGCYEADLLAAFDAAISDGVDIISLSIGSSFPFPFFEDSIAIGAYHAMKNGILTSAAAGNDGPGLGTVENFAPWILTVAASSIDRKFITEIKLGNGMVVQGISLNTFDPENKTFPIIYGADAKATSYEFSSSFIFCNEDEGLLNATLVAGKIVVCDVSMTGEVPIVSGAAGVIMQDIRFHDVAFSFPLPAASIEVEDGTRLLSYVRNFSSTPYGTILKSVEIKDTASPVVVSFSSRGPSPLTPGTLKPDLAAPGVDILAAYSPIAPPSDADSDPRSVQYNIISGTSMATPHASGVAAYVKSFHPTWSPSAIKSALMTTAIPMSSTANEEVEFAYGSGHINPIKAVNPGLVYDAEEDDYVNYLCNQGLNETQIRLISGKNDSCSKTSEYGAGSQELNYPSFALPTNAGAFDAVFYRTVTNVGSSNCAYHASVTTPEGQVLAINVHPNVLSFDSIGQKLSFTVRVSGSVGLRALMSASLVWDDGEHQVRSPIVVYNLS